MTTENINENNPSSVATKLAQENVYFVITADVRFTQDIITVGANSVLSFKGGSFHSVGKTTIQLNSCQVEAGAYPIFRDNISIIGFANTEVKAEWFKWSVPESDDVYINRAIIAAGGCPVVLESKTYTLKDSIRFQNRMNERQTLICPGTLTLDVKAGNIPAIDINAHTVDLKINKIVGNEIPYGYQGIGIKFSVYTDHSDIEVNTMSKLNKGFFVQPNVKGTHTDKPEKEVGGIQYCRLKFGSISADYCFYIDVFTHAQLFSNNQCINLSEINKDQLPNLKIKPNNWFNENQISGDLMQGKYGIYIVCPTEAWGDEGRGIKPENVSNVLNGLKFENISFERITDLPIRLRSVIRSSFVNMQMFNSLPGNNSSVTDFYAPWIDLANINEVRMSFHSFVIPTHIKLGDRCSKSYIYGAILDDPENYISHFDTLGIDTLYGLDSTGNLVKTSQMYVTNSVVPYNMAENITTDGGPQVITKNINELLPNLKDGTTNNDQISLPVLASTVNVDIKKGKTVVIDLTGLDSFAPCLYTVNARIESGGKLQFRAYNDLAIQGGTYNPAGCPPGTTIKEFTSGGLYQIQWLSNWVISIIKSANQ